MTTQSDAQAILKAATIENNVVKLNSGQLERSLYTKVNEVLERLWGKWNRKKNGHLFTYDPTAAIQAYIDSGILPAKNELSFFATPDSIIDEIMLYIEQDYHGIIRTVLEPSAGQGAIVDKIKEKHPQAAIDCVELSKLNAKILESKGYNVKQKDFLKDRRRKKYDLIIMNPPFNTPDIKNCYIDHIMHAYGMLENWGMLYAIVPTGWLTRNDKKHKEFREWLSARVDSKEVFDRGAFKASGTMVETCMLSFVGPGKIGSTNYSLRNIGFFHNGDYGYEYYRFNDTNKNISVEEYFDKCFIQSLDPKLCLDPIAWDYRDDCIEACKEWDLEYQQA